MANFLLTGRHKSLSSMSFFNTESSALTSTQELSGMYALDLCAYAVMTLFCSLVPWMRYGVCKNGIYYMAVNKLSLPCCFTHRCRTSQSWPDEVVIERCMPSFSYKGKGNTIIVVTDAMKSPQKPNSVWWRILLPPGVHG